MDFEQAEDMRHDIQDGWHGDAERLRKACVRGVLPWSRDDGQHHRKGQVMTARELIKQCRKRRGMTQADLARRAGFDNHIISLWENGVHEPRFCMVVRCLEAMDYVMIIRSRDGKRQINR